MAQDPQSVELHCRFPLEPRLGSKPPLNSDNILFGKFNHVCSLTDKPQCLNQSTHSLDKHVLVSGEPDENSSHICSMKNFMPMIFPDENVIFQRKLVNNIPEDMVITQKCLNIEDEITMNTQHSSQQGSQSQFGEKRQNFNEQCEIASERKHYLSMQNPTFLTTTCHAINDASSDLGDVKVQHWLPESICKDIKVPKSDVCETERQTNLLLKNLAAEKCNFNCSESCGHFGMTGRHEGDIDRVHFCKPRKQEFYLDSLIDEDIGSLSIKSNGSDKKCSLSKSDSHSVNAEKPLELLHLEMKTTQKLLLPSQRRGEQTDPEQLVTPSAHGEFEG
jgi:hypothetical protein